MDYVQAVGGALIVNAPQIVGFILPPFIELLNRDVKRENERFIVAILVCIIISVFLHWDKIAIGDPEKFIAYTGLIFMESQTVFKLYFANSWLRGRIRREEEEQITSTPNSPVQ